ncbi:MAG TPA: hypothetical protein VHZ03_26565 [Trebonia sp.]|nr:hypothetical protein [Trebonia sp.]
MIRADSVEPFATKYNCQKASHDLRDARTAMTHARLAWQIDGVTSTVRVWLHALEGRALAVLGDVDGALLAIDRPADARDHTQADDLDGIGGLCSFPAERQLYYAADTGAMLPSQLTASQLRRRATGYAEQAIAAYEGSPQPAFGDLAGARAALAISRVRAGELEGGRRNRPGAGPAPCPEDQRRRGLHPRRPPRAGRSPDVSVAAEVQEAIEAFATTPAAAITRG